MKRSENGSALPLALLVLLLVSVLGVTLFSLGMTEVAIGTNWRAYSSAFYAADAGVESGVVALRDLLSKTPNPAPADLKNISTPPAFLTAKNITFTNFSITTALPASPYSYATTFTTGPYTGLSGFVTDYQVTAQVTGEGGTKANLTQIVRYVQVPLFQFGVFYGKGVDLEVSPGPPMTFNGRVHANSNIYALANTTLQFDSYITTTGGIYRRVKAESAHPLGGNPQIKDANGIYRELNFDSDYKPGFMSKWASPQEWKDYAQSVFGPGGKESTVKDKAMGVGEIIPPIPGLFYNPSNPDVVAHQMIEMAQPGDSAELKAAKLYSRADLRIIDGVATDRNGNPVSLPAGAISTTTFWDKREQRDMTVVNVKIATLGSAAPANGILYVASTGGPGNAVRLVNGEKLPSQGLTVVSQNPVYVQGDYNTVNKVPAAILGDAITVLSNNWGPNSSDSKGNQVTSNRPASDTTVNAAFALGPSAESVLDLENGNLVNIMRFLEDWKGKTFEYKGSIVALWHSREATAPFCCAYPTGGFNYYYKAPTRKWSYDTMFNTNPPPGTPSGVIMMKGQWTQQ